MNWATSEGRASRSEFCWASVGGALAIPAAVAVGAALAAFGVSYGTAVSAGFAVLILATVLVGHAIARRLHDIGLSGWWLATPLPIAALMALFFANQSTAGGRTSVAIVGAFLAFGPWLFLVLREGSDGPNSFGPDPRASAPRARRADAPGADAHAILARMHRAALPTLLLTPAKDASFSKLGGEPELPPGVDWPAGIKTPRAFLAQLDLAEVRAADGPEWLPAEGHLYAFYDEERAGFADHASILFHPEAPGPARPAPDGLPPKMRFPERRAGFLRLTSVPSLDWLGVDVREIDVDGDELDELADLPNAPFGDELQHRIAGYPSEIQDARMALECEHLARDLEYEPGGEIAPAVERAAKSWRLLLQIDSDPALKMSWGDAGRLYVFVREKHALAGDFSKTVTLWQTY